MENLTSLIEFTQRFVSSITKFTSAVFNFMTYEFAIWDNITMFEVILGGGVALYLTASITKWLIGIVT